MSATLQAAQRAVSSVPYVSAVLSEYWGDRHRLRFERLYTGVEADAASAACGTGDGSLVRAWVTATNLFSKKISAPAAGSDFSSSPTDHGAVTVASGCALFSRGAVVFLVYVTGSTTLRYKSSSDNGATWSAAATVSSGFGTVTDPAGAFAPGGDALLVWVESTTVYRSRWNGTAWGARTAWTNTVAGINGLAVGYLLDWQVIVTGLETTSTDALVWSCIYGDGVDVAVNTWSALTEVARGSLGSEVTYVNPAVGYTGTDWRLFFVESFGGTGAYDRLQASTMSGLKNFLQLSWREPFAFDFTTVAGVAVAGGQTAGVSAMVQNLGATFWLSSPAGVWRAAMPAQADLDVSGDLVACAVEADEDGGTAVVELDNSRGQYTAYGAGALAGLRRGARLQLQPGYRTAAGNETPGGTVPSYWVESIELVTGPRPRVVIEARDAWSVLEAWRARRSFQWAAGVRTVFQLLSFVTARAGLDYTTVSSSAFLTAYKPAFLINPGESGKAAVLRLLRQVEDRAFFRSAQLTGLETDSSDAVDYALGEGGHTILEGRYRDETPAANRVAVHGVTLVGEAFDFDEIAADVERLQLVSDRSLTAAADAATRAADLLRVAELTGRRDAVTLFGVSCGQELYDVVSLTDGQAGLAAAKRRVLGLRWWFAPERARGPVYAMTLTLGAP